MDLLTIRAHFSAKNQIDKKIKQRIECMVFAALAGIAVGRWTIVSRAANALPTASLTTLERLTQQEPYNRRAFYYLGLRWQERGDYPRSDAALEHAATLDSDDAQVWLAWAAERTDANQNDGAIRILAPFAAQHPTNAAAHLALARLYHRTQAYKPACAEAESAVRSQPDLAEAWQLLGKDAESIQDYVGAEKALRKTRTLKPLEAADAFDLGQFLVRRERAPEAVPFFQEAVRLAPDLPASHLALGEALLQTAHTPADFAAARDSLQRSAKLRPGHPQTCLALGDSYLRQGRWQDALTALHPLQELQIDGIDRRVRATYLRAQAYQGLGNLTAAAQQLLQHQKWSQVQQEKAAWFDRIQQNHADPAPRRQLARLCVRCGDYAEADALYRKLLEYAPTYQAAQQELADLEAAHPLAGRAFAAAPAHLAIRSASGRVEEGDRLRIAGHGPEAKAAYLDALAQDGHSARACQGIGLLLEAQGDVENAFAYLQQAVSLDPALPLAQRTLAKLYLQAGFPNEAQRRLMRSVADAPEDAAGWYDLGLVARSAAHDPSQSEAAFQHAVTLVPTNARYLLDWADALTETHRDVEAESAYRRALAADPQSADTQSRLGAFLLDYRSAGQHPAARQEEAERLLRSALARDGISAFTRYHLARLERRQGHTKEAITLLQAALKQRPDMVAGWYELAQTLQHEGRSSEAHASLQRSEQLQKAYAEYTRIVGLIALSPKRADLRLLLARQNTLRGENAHALNQYQVCLQLDPQNHAAQTEMAALTARLKTQGHLPNMGLYNAMVNSFSTRSRSFSPPNAAHSD